MTPYGQAVGNGKLEKFLINRKTLLAVPGTGRGSQLPTPNCCDQSKREQKETGLKEHFGGQTMLNNYLLLNEITVFKHVRVKRG